MYDHRTTPSQIDIPGSMTANVAVTNIAGNKALGTIVIPAYNGKLLAAYLEFEADSYSNAAGGRLDGDQYIQIDDGGGYVNAILLPDDIFEAAGAVTNTNSAIARGAIDIKAYCTPSTTLTLQWTAAKSTTNQTFYTVKTRLFLIFA